MLEGCYADVTVCWSDGGLERWCSGLSDGVFR